MKFLYCAFCKDAVAKRNFRKRHQHEQSENSGVKMVDSARAVHWVGAGGTKEASGQLQAALISGSCSHPSEESQSGSGSTLTNSHEAGRKRLASVIAMRTDLRAKLAKLEPKRKEAWDLLLASRPDTAQSNKMSAWLMHIMALSDKAKPLSEDPIEAVLKTSETAESPNNDPAASSMSNDSGNETSRDSAQSNAMANGVAQHSRKRKAASCLSPQTTDGSSNYESNETSSDTQSNEYSNSRNSSERSSDTQSNDSSSDNQERTTSNDSSSEN